MEINQVNNKSPWVEKYKPTNLDEVILSDVNKRILSNIIKTKDFPNVIFYGPPGTGKTTAIINLVKKYHQTLGQKHHALTIHLNASDDRGVDVVRTQIHQFVHTKQLFFPGTKFVILDEVDYMTEVAQQALRYLIQTSIDNNVRFCLICNYIGKIDEKLQTNFIKIRFNQLPVTNMMAFLTNISTCENMNLSVDVLQDIQRQFQSDMRSMINIMQIYASHTMVCSQVVINDLVYETLYKQIMNTNKNKEINKETNTLTRKNITQFIQQIKSLAQSGNIGEICVLKKIIQSIVWNERKNPRCSAFMNFAESVIHNKNLKYAIHNTIIQIHKLQ